MLKHTMVLTALLVSTVVPAQSAQPRDANHWYSDKEGIYNINPIQSPDEMCLNTRVPQGTIGQMGYNEFGQPIYFLLRSDKTHEVIPLRGLKERSPTGSDYFDAIDKFDAGVPVDVLYNKCGTTGYITVVTIKWLPTPPLGVLQSLVLRIGRALGLKLVQ